MRISLNAEMEGKVGGRGGGGASCVRISPNSELKWKGGGGGGCCVRIPPNPWSWNGRGEGIPPV